MDLTALQNSAFLQSLGWAIANSLWQAAILWGLYQLINNSYRNASARFRSNFATLFLFSTFGWFLVTFFMKFFTLSNGAEKTLILSAEQLGQLSQYLNQPDNFINWQQLATDASAALPYLSLAYLLLLIIFCSRWASAYRHIHFIRKYGLQKPDVEWRLFTDKSAMHIGIHKKIRIWFSKHVDVPATIGYFKPVILIPLASLNQLSVEQLEAIILHELAHIKRNDYLLNLFISMIETLLFFNPFVVLLAKVVKRERENCCDDFVIQYQYDRHSYASALLSIERYRLQQNHLAMSATSGKKQLLVRVRRIMENNQGKSGLNYGQKLLALLLITGMIISLAWLSPSDKPAVVAGKKGDIPTALPIPKGEHLARFSKKENISVDVDIKELRKTFTSKQLADLKKLVEEQIKPAAGELMESAMKELPSAFINDKFETSFPAPDRKTWARTDKAALNALSFQQASGSNLLNLIATQNEHLLESYLNKITSVIDVQTLQSNIEKVKVEIAAIDWKKIEKDLQINFQQVQKQLDNLPEEVKKNMPSYHKLLRDELIKANAAGEMKKVVRLRKVPATHPRTGNTFALSTDTARLPGIPKSRVYTSDRDYYAVPDQAFAYTVAPVAEAPAEYRSYTTGPSTYTFKMDNSYEYGTPEIIELKGKGDVKYHIELKEGFLMINGEKISLKKIKERSNTRLRTRLNTDIKVNMNINVNGCAEKAVPTAKQPCGK